jgi:outer membrane immunogenic protein
MCLALSGLPANAGDMAKRAAAPAPAVAAAPSWTGFYFGPTVGYTFASAQGDYTGIIIPPAPAPMVFYPFDLNPSGASLGGQAGYNFQFGPWVFGLEGDWSWVFSASDRGFDPAGSGRYDDVTLLWTGHARGRIGYLYNQFLIFFSGGAAFAGTEAKHFVPAGNTLYFETRTLVGYSLGGGIETFWTNNWIFRIEYLHDHFGNQHYDWVAGSRYSNSDLTLDTVRVSFIWRP